MFEAGLRPLCALKGRQNSCIYYLKYAYCIGVAGLELGDISYTAWWNKLHVRKIIAQKSQARDPAFEYQMLLLYTYTTFSTPHPHPTHHTTTLGRGFWRATKTSWRASLTECRCPGLWSDRLRRRSKMQARGLSACAFEHYIETSSARLRSWCGNHGQHGRG